MTDDNDITITADGATVHASEKVSTGDYENATLSQTLDVSIEGVDVTDGVPDDLQSRLSAIQRALRNACIQAAEERKEEAQSDEYTDDRVHEVQ